MARRSREDEAGSWHHIVNRGIAKRPLFEDRVDVRFFLSRIAREVRRGRLEVHAWCAMTTHFHLLVRSPAGQMSEALRRAQNEYVRFFNRRHRRDGTLIRGRFLSKRVRSLTYRTNVVRYIDSHPVRAGVAKFPWHYPWCSAAQYARADGPPWLERSWIESWVASLSGHGEFRSEDYCSAMGNEFSPALEQWIEERLVSLGTGPDDIDGLVNATSESTRRWMQRKAKLADGTAVGLPVCDDSSIRRAREEMQAELGAWEVTPHGRRRDGWLLAEVGLLRSLAGFGHGRIALGSNLTESACRRHARLHTELLQEDRDYARRAAELCSRAMRACHPAAPTPRKMAEDGATR